MKRVGVFGGTFDPVHIGHLILAQEAFSQLELDRIFWVLTPHSPHKDQNQITCTHTRLRMLRACIQDNPNFIISTVDCDREPPYFAVDTMDLLSRQHQNNRFYYLLGGDSLNDLPSWNQPKIFLSKCYRLAVMRRPNDQVDLESLDNTIPGIAEKIAWIDAPIIGISSSQIRTRISSKFDVRYYLHPAVYQIIRDEKIYNG